MTATTTANRPPKRRQLAPAMPTLEGGKPKSRLRQLLDLAKEGNAEANADLFREFGFRFGEEEMP